MMIRKMLVENIKLLFKKYFPDEMLLIKELPDGSVELQFLKYRVELFENGWINIVGPDIYWRLEIHDFRDVLDLETKFLEKLEVNLKNYEAFKDLPIPDTTPLFDKLWNWLKK
jgi:hypothetical protein